MAGPWEDFKPAPAADKSGPWDDFKINPTGSTLDNLRAGAGKAMVDAVRGGVQLAGDFLTSNPLYSAMLPDKAREVLARNNADIEESRRRDAPLMDTKAGTIGNLAGNVALTLAAPQATTATGAAAVGGILGALQPVAKDESRAVNTAAGAAAGAGAMKLGEFLRNFIGAKLANANQAAAARQAADAERVATLQAARAEGLMVAPGEAPGAGIGARALGGMSNKINLQQAVSQKNAEAVNAIARRELGLAQDTPLNEATLQGVRDIAGKAYEAVQNLRAINWDKQFEKEVNGLARQKLGGVTSNPADGRITQLMDELKSLRQVDGASIVADIKNLREMAKANFKAVDRAGGDVGSQALAQAQMKAADILEGLAERNLSLNKAPASLIQELRDARKLIAKTYTIENAINEGAGNVSAQKLAQALNRGAPLENGLLTAAKFGNAFSKSAQSPEKMGAVPPFTMTDLVTGAVGGTVNPALAGLALVRPAARSVVLSKMMQDSLANPSYAAPTALRAADAVAWSPALRALLPGLGAAGVIPQVQQ